MQRDRDLLYRIAAGLALVALFLVWWSRARQDEAASSPRTAIFASTPVVGDNDIRLDGWVDDSRVSEGKPVAFWLAIQNASSGPISNVSVVTFRHPGLGIPSQERGCWDPPPPREPVTPQCAGPRRLPITLASGEAATIEGHLVATTTGRYAISAVIAWRDARLAGHRKPIRIEPIRVDSRWAGERSAFVSAVQNFLKDLALPIVLVWLGYRLKRIEEQREEKRKKAEDRIARLQQTWTLMMPKLHENAEKYYMPLMANAWSAVRYYDGPSKDANVCFFFYLLFLAQMKQMIDAISGFYLKNRDGEHMVSVVWERVMLRSDALFTRPVRERAQLLVQPLLTYSEFSLERVRNPELRSMSVTFLEPAAYQDFRTTVLLLNLFAIVLNFETNSSYVFWYGQSEAFPDQEFAAGLNDLKTAVGTAPEYADLLKQFDKYGNNAKKRVYESQV